MYKAIYNKNGSLAHANECKMVFGRKDTECPRCVEMLKGAPARSGWQQDYFKNKAQDEAQRLGWLKQHLASCNCGPVCTYGEW